MSKRRAATTLGAAILSAVIVTFAIASGSRPAPAIAYPDVKSTPDVCSHAGARCTVKVPEEALNELRQLRVVQARTGLELGSPPNKDAPVFAFPDGRPWSPNGIESLWKRLVKDAGIGHVRIHDLRHTAASQLIARGVPITTVSARLGHSKPTTTLAIYSHAMEGGQEIASQVIGELLKSAGKDNR